MYTLILVTNMPIGGYGLYTLVFSYCLLFSGMVDALISTQFSLNYSSIDNKKKSEFISNCFILIGLVGLVFFGLALSLYFIFYKNHEPDSLNVLEIAICFLMFVGYAIRELVNKLGYVSENLKINVKANFAILVMVLIEFSTIKYLDINLSVRLAVLLLTINLSLGCLIGMITSGLRWSPNIKELAKNPIIRSYHSSTWALVGVIVSWAQAQGYSLVLGHYHGNEAIGTVNAVRLVVFPVMFALTPIASLELPKLIEIKNKGGVSEIHKKINMLTLLTSSLAALYSIFVLVICCYFKPKILPDLILQNCPILLSWAVYIVALSLRTYYVMEYQVKGYFKKLTLINLVSCVISIGIGAGLTGENGATGMMVGMIIGELLFAFLLAKRRI